VLIVFFQLQNFAAHVHRDLARDLAIELTESVKSFHVPATPFTSAWPPSLPFGTHLARHARHFRRKDAQLLNHRVHDVRGTEELAFQGAAIHVEPDGPRQVALRNGGDRVRDLVCGAKQIFNQGVYRNFHVVPRPAALLNTNPFASLAFLPNRLSNALQLQRHLLVGRDNLIEAVGDLAWQSCPGNRQAHTEISVFHGLEILQNDGKELGRGRLKSTIALGKDLLPAFPKNGSRYGYFHSSGSCWRAGKVNAEAKRRCTWAHLNFHSAVKLEK
jgi:hypothetical protein